MILKETSEKSDASNWVKQALLNSNINIYEAEGYTVKGDRVSALLDRRLVKDMSQFDGNDQTSVRDIIIKTESSNGLIAKQKFASLLNCKYSYMLYSYKPEKILIYNIEQDSVILRKSYDDFLQFAIDLSSKRDRWMVSVYEEPGLPVIDKLLRAYNLVGILANKIKNNSPNSSDNDLINRIKNSYKSSGKDILSAGGMIAWPGNLDGLLTDVNGNPKAIIEFSTVNKGTVSEHCHNAYFKKSKNRKGDEDRWRVVEFMRRQTKLPLIIIVWSPNKNDTNIKLKIVDKIVFSNEISESEIGIHYKSYELLDIEKLKQTIISFTT